MASKKDVPTLCQSVNLSHPLLPLHRAPVATVALLLRERVTLEAEAQRVGALSNTPIVSVRELTLNPLSGIHASGLGLISTLQPASSATKFYRHKPRR